MYRTKRREQRWGVNRWLRARLASARVSENVEISQEDTPDPVPEAGTEVVREPVAEPVTETSAEPPAAVVETTPREVVAPIDLDAIERDLTDVQTALDRLNEGTYWVDEVSGEEIPADVLAERPTVRSVSAR